MDDFLAKLRKAKVKRLLDVRQIAFSRRQGFSKKALGEALASVGIKYDHLPSLGSPAAARKQVRIDHNWNKLFVATRKHYKTKEAQAALEQVEQIARKEKSALMCYCLSASSCHRKVLVEKLEPKGFEFVHF